MQRTGQKFYQSPSQTRKTHTHEGAMACLETPDFPVIAANLTLDGSPTFRAERPDVFVTAAFPAIVGLESVVAAAKWSPRREAPANDTTGFFSEALAASIAQALDPMTLPPRTFGIGFVPDFSKKRRVNPCFRVSRVGMFSDHRDLPATFEDGCSDYSLVVYLEVHGDDATLQIETGVGVGDRGTKRAGCSIMEELVATSRRFRSSHVAIPLNTGTAVLFSQRYVHSAAGGFRRLVLRTDIVQPGTWREEGIDPETKRVAQALFRNAQMADLAGFQDMAQEMYERSTHIRLCAASTNPGRDIHPRALFLSDHYMELASGCTACVARSGTSYLFFHGRLYGYGDTWVKADIEPIVVQAATFVLANMLNRDLPPLVFKAPLLMEDFNEFDLDETGRGTCGDSGAITAQDLVLDAKGHVWVTSDGMLPSSRIGTVKVPIFTKDKVFVRCCGDDAATPPPKTSKPYERTSRGEFGAVADIPSPTVVFDAEDGSSGHVWFDMEPNKTSTFHHAACFCGYKVVAKTEVGTVRHPVRCTMRFELALGGLMCIVAKPYVVL